jgi:hypothetical protein
MCSEKQRLLAMHCDVILALSRDFAAEHHLPASKRVRTNLTRRKKEFIKAMLDQHLQEHGCGRPASSRRAVISLSA